MEGATPPPPNNSFYQNHNGFEEEEMEYGNIALQQRGNYMNQLEAVQVKLILLLY